MNLVDIIVASLVMIGVAVYAICRINWVKKRRDAEDLRRKNTYAYR